MEEHEKEIINLALDKLLNKKSYFDICIVDKVAETLNVNPGINPDYRFLSTLHCINYSDMSNDLKEKLPAMIMAVLSGRFDISLMTKALVAVQTGEIKDLPNTEDDYPTRNVSYLR